MVQSPGAAAGRRFGDPDNTELANNVFTIPVPGNSTVLWLLSVLQRPTVEDPGLPGVQLLDTEEDENVISEVPEADGTIWALAPVRCMGERFQSTC
mmetsp:Transcript_111942/g.297548  ORF Transcript_111942/g.297548 Transcript_111942/m.297548 type:complete len:96 (+) Transcript_111942:304-591(+)